MDRRTPPSRFIDLVARRAADVRTTLYQATGDNGVAATVRDRLFVLTAARWAWLDLRGRLARRDDIADRYLDRMVRQEIAEWRTTGPDADPGLQVRPTADHWWYGPGGPPRSPDDGSPNELATRSWREAGPVLRRRLLITAIVLLVLWCGVYPRLQSRSGREQATTPVIRPPAIAMVLPAPALLAAAPARTTPVPGRIDLSRAAALGSLADHPVRRALAVLQPDPDYLIILGEDGRTRFLDTGTWKSTLFTTALSPDGTAAAFADVQGVRIMDLRTGTAREYPGVAYPAAVVWRSGSRLLLEPPGGISAEIDLPTGRSVSVSYQAGDTLTAQDARADAPVLELHSTGGMQGGGARFTSWSGDTTSDVALTADPAGGFQVGWLGGWRGQGFTYRDRAVRNAVVTDVPVASGAGAAMFGTVTLTVGTGMVDRVLLTTDTGGVTEPPDVLGFLDTQTVLLRTGALLVSWRTDDGTFGLVSTLSGPAAASLADLTTW